MTEGSKLCSHKRKKKKEELRGGIMEIELCISKNRPNEIFWVFDPNMDSHRDLHARFWIARLRSVHLPGDV
ncbi:hypothetical protein CDL15_Pgr017272 [Punica granatum]|uniref:Uncharacterized protein n=1 Tax=Punica granatum TaxID=22663 RepID=A0A218WR91_PUNGR|nr:hypothetical protein CDL15_Pgr017272 [Punica granatum]